MMQELRLVLIVLGALVIAALIIHGLWSSRKERPEKFADKPLGKLKDGEEGGFDEDGIGAVRVIKSNTDKPEEIQRKEPGFHFDDEPAAVDPLFADLKADIEPSSSPVTNEEKDLLFTDAPYADEADDKSTEISEPLPVGESEQEEAVSESPVRQEVLIVNVQSSANDQFQGIDLMNSLEQNGMIHGEMDIFHRHADLSGTGKVLFSAANMYNPGSFPLENINQFTTQGISFFMTLPCYGDAEQNFKLMLQTAQKVADQLGGLVTDDSRNLMTPQRLDGYREQVKSFSEPA
ncbi:cell division protein ZipA [Veronia nyctiphanis]|uniref:Cell division protein ZipA n=1 Tax=Veronia nyctiphanis TaxID=1278244 RepID=A0A4Q0YL94_9GAMM|nr:cell division protein ZipA [Veronia nyctiphanis]RXJ71436.1 cell division protein ZipA [Veronia nyctiphanis]